MRTATVLAVLIVASGCVARSSTPDGMVGEWRMVMLDDAEPAMPARARLTFEDERLSATAGCNGMGGPWRIEQNRLIAGPLAGTRMHCVGPVWEQEQALSALLVAAPTIAYDDGELILRSSRHSARLERINPPQPAS